MKEREKKRWENIGNSLKLQVGITPINVNPGLVNHGSWTMGIHGGTIQIVSNSDQQCYIIGTPQKIKQPFGLCVFLSRVDIKEKTSQIFQIFQRIDSHEICSRSCTPYTGPSSANHRLAPSWRRKIWRVRKKPWVFQRKMGPVEQLN